MIKYDQHDTCPFKPIHTMEWLEKYFKKSFYKKPYDRFTWWRSYTPKVKPLGKESYFKVKVMNGDYDFPHYKYEAEIVEHKLRKAYLAKKDIASFIEQNSLDLARRKRLLEDHDKEETRRLEALYKECKTNYSLNNDEVDHEILQLKGDSVKDLYKVLEEKYWTRTNFNKR
jgi:hypothetical protein